MRGRADLPPKRGGCVIRDALGGKVAKPTASRRQPPKPPGDPHRLQAKHVP